MNKSNKNSFVYSFFANPATHVPPVLNNSIFLAKKNIQNIIISYKSDSTRKIESLTRGAKIFRLTLKSKNIRFAHLRKIAVVIEIILIFSKIAHKKRPFAIILFNEIASLAGLLIKNNNQIHWALEYPENETKTFLESILKKQYIQAWKKSLCVIFPSNYRKAMGFVLAPFLIKKQTLTIHNAPLKKEVKPQPVTSSGAIQATRFISEMRELNRTIIVYTGAVGNRYGWDILIKSIGSIKERFALLILGTKHELGVNEFTEAIQNCKYPENILWMDSIPYFEMQTVIKDADIGFVHYRGDTLNTYFSAPGKLYEYLKAGLCILTDNNSCITEDLSSTQSGILFSKPINQNEIVDLLMKLNTTELRIRRANARNLFLNKYNFEQQALPLIQFLKAGTWQQ